MTSRMKEGDPADWQHISKLTLNLSIHYIDYLVGDYAKLADM